MNAVGANRRFVPATIYPLLASDATKAPLRGRFPGGTADASRRIIDRDPSRTAKRMKLPIFLLSLLVLPGFARAAEPGEQPSSFPTGPPARSSISASGAYLHEPSFQRYRQARAETLRRGGKTVDLWR